MLVSKSVSDDNKRNVDSKLPDREKDGEGWSPSVQRCKMRRAAASERALVYVGCTVARQARLLLLLLLL